MMGPITPPMVPSKEKWQRDHFLSARKRQFEAFKDQPVNNPLFKNAEVIHVQPDEKLILCDGCGAEILADHIQLVEWGRRVACDPCYDKWHAKDPVRYRILKADGTLGRIVGGHDEEH